MENICNADFIPWDDLKNTTIFVTGGTGLIGSTLINALIYANQKRELNLRVLALARDKAKAEQRFEKLLVETSDLCFIKGCVEELPDIYESIDYIIHGASQTASKAFVEQPVETIQTSVYGTNSILKLAREKQVRGMVYLSSMEVYGYPQRGHKVTEDEIGALSPLDVRNSYPISKIQCESLCCAYAKEYNVPAKIVRLTQTFGPGVHEKDCRIFAELGRCIKEKRDIVLKTKGETERNYLYTAEAITAILCVLLKGSIGQIYNAANEMTYCSIREVAQMVADGSRTQLRYELQDESHCGYPQTLYMNLDIQMLKELGWKPMDYAFCKMYQRMIQ